MREQTACNLTVRLTWEVAPGEDHPRETFDCAQDADMAITLGQHVAASAPADQRRLISVETSPSGGRRHPWTRLEFQA